MADRHLRSVLQHVRDLVGSSNASSVTDVQLLERFLSQRDEVAFEVILRRHGPLVMRVCRRVLPNGHDAEDAFQATFLVFVRKARSIGKRASVASWLYQVAHRVALRARLRASQRAATNQPSGDVAAAADESDGWRELRPVLDEEVRRLPEKYRTPVVLCYFEGQAYEKAAREIGCPKGTLSIRLTRARGLLRKRLARRGIALSLTALTAVLAENAASALSAALVDTTVKAAVHFIAGIPGGIVSENVLDLTKRTLTAMVVTKVKLAATALAAVCVIAVGSGLFLSNLLAAKPTEPASPVVDVAGEVLAAAEPQKEKQQPGTDVYGDPLPGSAVARLGTLRWRHEATCLAYSSDGKFLATGGNGNQIALWDAATGKEIHRWKGHVDFHDSVDARSKDFFVHRAYVFYQPAAGANGTEARGMIFDLAFSPDNKTLASVACDGKVRLWDVATGKQRLAAGGHVSPLVTSVAFSSDGKFVASGSVDGTVRVWDVATGKESRVLNGLSVHKGNTGTYTATSPVVRFSPKENVLAGAGEGFLLLWDAATGKELHRLDLDVKKIGGCVELAFSPDGRTLVGAGGYDKTLYIWEVATGKQLQAVKFAEEVFAVAMAPDGKKLAVAMVDSPLFLVDCASGKVIEEIPGVNTVAGCRCLAFSPDGKVLSTTRPNEPVRHFDLTGKEVKEVQEYGGSFRHMAHSLFYSADGKTLISGNSDQRIRVWDAATGKELRRLGSKEFGLMSIMNRMVPAIAASADGKQVAYATAGKIRNGQGPDEIAIPLISTESGKLIRQFKGTEPPPALSWDNYFQVALAPNGKLLAGIDYLGAIHFWDVATGEELGLLEADVGAKNHQGGEQPPLIFSADSRTVATALTLNHEVRLWDVATRKLLQSFDGHQKKVLSVALSSDGKLLAAGGEDESIRVWEISTGNQVHKFTGHRGSVLSVAFSLDSKQLASGGEDQTIRIWELSTAKEVGQFRGHRGAVVSLAFSPDGKSLASGSRDMTALIWELAKLSR